MQYQSCCLKFPVRIRKKGTEKCLRLPYAELHRHQNNRKKNYRRSVLLSNMKWFCFERPFLNEKRNSDLSLQEDESPMTFEGYNFACLRALKRKDS